ncbi:MAG: DUF4175 family protein [Rhodospirillales bacterium]|nr:DUF4175 family protein [Rhodospirillales bacterium]
MTSKQPLPPGLPAWKYGAAWGGLALETLIRSTWQAAFWAAFWVGLILTDAPSVFGPYGLPLAGALFYIGFFWFSVKGAKAFHLPSRHDALRRIECKSGLLHRPLTAAGDRMADTAPAPQTQILWNAARRRSASEAQKARLFGPDPIMARHDPLALRHGAALLLTAGLVMAGAQGPALLQQALIPFRGADADDEPGHAPITLWINPPKYTGLPATSIAGRYLPENEPPLTLPQGSVVKVRVSGGWGTPIFWMGGVDHPLPSLDPDTHGGEFPGTPPVNTDSARLEIHQFGLPRATFAYAYIPDAPPTLAEKTKPETLAQGQIRFSLTTQDDYGVRDMVMNMTPDPAAGDMPLGEPLSQSRPVMSPAKTQTDVNPVYDLSAHPWAGLPVLMTFTVTDAIGQKATLGPVSVVLPEREFRHPIAKRLVALRKELGWTPLASREETSGEIEDILSRPGLYGGDTTVFLALRSAASRLFYTDDVASVREVMDILWDTALKIEDGNLSLAARDLRAARDALEQALRDPDTPDEELAELNDQLRQALAHYFSELGKEIQKRMAEGQSVPIMPPDMMADVLDGNALQRFLDRLNAESLSGDREKAMEMLSRLQKLTDSLGTSTLAPMPEDMQAMAEGISELQELVRKQEALRDQTLTQAQEHGRTPDLSWPDLLPPTGPGGPNMGKMPPPPNAGSASPPPGGDTRANKAEQEALRLVLGQIMKEVGAANGDVPDNLGKAELSMRDASAALGENDPTRAIPHQDKALRHLREGAKDMASALSEKLGKMTGLALGSTGEFDPLGRPQRDPNRPSGLLDDQDVEVPTEAEKRRVDAILKTLRDRAADPSRPETELEYLRRLLKQF